MSAKKLKRESSPQSLTVTTVGISDDHMSAQMKERLDLFWQELVDISNLHDASEADVLILLGEALSRKEQSPCEEGELGAAVCMTLNQCLALYAAVQGHIRKAKKASSRH